MGAARALLVAALACGGAGAAAMEQARQDYILNCQGCHLADAGGAPGKVPRMKDFLGYFLQVPGGREFIVQVPGVAHAPLDDARVAAVMNWVLRTFSAAQLPGDFRPYTAEEVGTLRAGSLLDVNARRAELLRAIESDLGVTEPAPGP